jgi:hypothetical protein
LQARECPESDPPRLIAVIRLGDKQGVEEVEVEKPKSDDLNDKDTRTKSAVVL